MSEVQAVCHGHFWNFSLELRSFSTGRFLTQTSTNCSFWFCKPSEREMFLILFLTSRTHPTPNIAMYCVYIYICILLNGHVQQLLYVANTKLFSEAKKQSQGPFSPNPATNKHVRRFIRISKPTHCNPGGWQLWTPIDFIDNDPKFFLEGIISGKGIGLVPDPGSRSWPVGFFWGMSLFWVVVSSICYFHPYLGRWSNLKNIFQMGWNHQLLFFSNDLQLSSSPPSSRPC